MLWLSQLFYLVELPKAPPFFHSLFQGRGLPHYPHLKHHLQDLCHRGESMVLQPPGGVMWISPPLYLTLKGLQEDIKVVSFGNGWRGSQHNQNEKYFWKKMISKHVEFIHSSNFSVQKIKICWSPSTPIHLWVVYGCFGTLTVELSSCHKDPIVATYDSQNLKYLLFVPLWKIWTPDIRQQVKSISKKRMFWGRKWQEQRSGLWFACV